MPEIRIEESAGAPRVMLRDSATDTVLPALWLRARSQDPSQRDRVTGQRLVNPHLMPEDLALTEARLESPRLYLSFSDGFSGWFDTQELINGAVLSEKRALHYGQLRICRLTTSAR